MAVFCVGESISLSSSSTKSWSSVSGSDDESLASLVYSRIVFWPIGSLYLFAGDSCCCGTADESFRTCS